MTVRSETAALRGPVGSSPAGHGTDNPRNGKGKCRYLGPALTSNPWGHERMASVGR
jgi:hypothetical protein